MIDKYRGLWRMPPKEYLEQARKLNAKIKSAQAEAQSYRDLASSTAGVDPGKFYSGQSSDEAAFARFTDKALEIEERIRRDILRLAELKREIGEAIDKLEDSKERRLLRYRYLCFLSWRSVSAKMGYGVSNLYKIHREALKKITVPKNFPPVST